MEKNKKIKIAVFADEIEFLLAKLSNHPRFDFVYLANRDSAFDRWAVNNIRGSEIINYRFPDSYRFSDREDYSTSILRHSDVAEILKKNNIQFLWALLYNENVNSFSSWCSEHKIKIIGYPKIQKKFENKIWFDGFLGRRFFPKPDSWVGCLPKNLILPLRGKIVLQKAVSSGGEGTFFSKKRQELRVFLRDGKLNYREEYLFRRHINGLPLGVTLLISSQAVILSAVRRQCFVKQEKEPCVFQGLQWVPSSHIAESVRKLIEIAFKKLGLILYQKKLFGFFNFDFIVDKNNKLYLIECNPRMSSASAQLFHFPCLTHNIDMANLFLKDFFTPNQSVNECKFYGLPEIDFNGSVLDINFFPREKEGPLVIKKKYRNGVYIKEGNRLSFLSPLFKNFDLMSRKILIKVEAEVGDIYFNPGTFATVFSNYPLFDQEGNINHNGQDILNYFPVQ